MCSSREGVGGGAERKYHGERGAATLEGPEGTCRRGTWRARATRGGQLRRRASGDRALKGPTPHAPSSCQLSPSSSLLLPLLPSISLALSLALSFSLSVLAARMRLSSFSSPLSPHVTSFFSHFRTSPSLLSFGFSFLLTDYTAPPVFSTFTGFLALSGYLFLPRHEPSSPSPSVVAVGADQLPRNVTLLGPRVLNPRRRVSRFKLTRGNVYREAE